LAADGREFASKQQMMKPTFLPAAIAILSIVACSPPIAVKRLSPEAAQREQTANVLTSGRLSDFTTIELRRYDLLERFDDDPADAIQALHARVQAGTARSEELFALAELSYLHAQDGGGRPHYLASAVYAYALIFREVDEGDTLSDLDPRKRWAAEIYNRALAEAFAKDGTESLSLESGSYALPFGQLSITVDKQHILKPGVWEIIELEPAADVSIRGLRNRYRRVGIGTPLAGNVKISDENVRGAKYAAKTAHVPVTMVLRLEQPRAQLRGMDLHAELDLFPFSDVATVDIGGVAVPLESEPSVALAETLAASRFWEREMSVFLGHALGQKASSRFAVIEPYRQGRIPVIFVHGTGSSSARWADMVNDLLADPRIHGNFHFWMFQYDSGNPIPYSAYKLRSGLIEIEKFLNPDGTNRCAAQSVVMGHSQGGLLTKMTVIDSDDAFWRNASSKPFDEVKMSPEQRQLASDALFVEPLPFVTRVIFVATPHHGSYLAGPQFIRRLLQRLITLPADVISLGATLATAAVGADPTAANALELQTLPTAIDNMSPTHPFIRAISKIPIAPGVKAHSIIPVKGTGPYENGNDGVVRYSSAHIDGVESELVVRSSHSTQSNPHTIEEVRRILLEHLAASGCDSTPDDNHAVRPAPLSRVPASGQHGGEAK
jgi:pimeloyl-ACP methyl ester carboxylesterase